MSILSALSSMFRPAGQIDFNGLTDWHCHILPGVDDGVEDIETSLAILGDYERMGIKRVWLTPHIMEDVANTTDRLRQRYADLMARYTGPVDLRLAAENMIDSLFNERLAAGDLLPIGEKQNMLLVETSYFNPPYNLHRTLDRIKSKGYHPLLAHPERYNYIDSMAEYVKLKDMGVLFQLNILSLIGYYGKHAKEKSRKLLKKGMYDFCGTDLHRHEQLTPLRGDIALPADLLAQFGRLSSSLG